MSDSSRSGNHVVIVAIAWPWRNGKSPSRLLRRRERQVEPIRSQMMIEQAELAIVFQPSEHPAALLLPDLAQIVGVLLHADTILLKTNEKALGLTLGQDLLTGGVGGCRLLNAEGLRAGGAHSAIRILLRLVDEGIDAGLGAGCVVTRRLDLHGRRNERDARIQLFHAEIVCIQALLGLRRQFRPQ